MCLDEMILFLKPSLSYNEYDPLSCEGDIFQENDFGCDMSFP